MYSVLRKVLGTGTYQIPKLGFSVPCLLLRKAGTSNAILMQLKLKLLLLLLQGKLI
jgi:hypothetical protein